MSNVVSRIATATLVLAALATWGCGGRVHDADSEPVDRILPSNGGASGTTSGIGSSPAASESSHPAFESGTDAGDAALVVDAGRDAAALPDAGHNPLVGVWVGQVEHTISAREATGPDAPPQHVVLVVAEADGGLVGSILFGDAAPPPKATDPDAFYPPITPARMLGTQSIELAEMVVSPFDGQPYTLFYAHWTEARLTFQFMPAELWKDWCALQPKTYFLDDGSGMRWSCAPARSTSFEMAEVGKATLCIGNGVYPCLCDIHSCHFDDTGNNAWTVDLELNGDALEGLTYAVSSLSGVWNDGVKLRRVSR